ILLENSLLYSVFHFRLDRLIEEVKVFIANPSVTAGNQLLFFEMSASQRKRNAKSRSPALFAIERQMAVMKLYKLVGERQPDARAAEILPGIKPVECPVDMVRCHAEAVVLHADYGIPT